MACSKEYEELSTLEILKSTGGILRIFGKAEEQLAEINSVLDFLVKAKLLIPSKRGSVRYFGIDFENVMYEVSPALKDLVDKAEKQTQNKEECVYLKMNQKNYIFNLNFTLNKLAEIKVGLVNL